MLRYFHYPIDTLETINSVLLPSFLRLGCVVIRSINHNVSPSSLIQQALLLSYSHNCNANVYHLFNTLYSIETSVPNKIIRFPKLNIKTTQWVYKSICRRSMHDMTYARSVSRSRQTPKTPHGTSRLSCLIYMIVYSQPRLLHWLLLYLI